MLSMVDRQLLAHWRGRTFGKAKAGPRVAIVGNCQTFGYAYGVKLFNPAVQVDRYALVSKTYADLKLLTKVLSTYDAVFAQDFGPGLLRDNADSEALRAAMPGIKRLPFVNFFGFHPDTVYLFDPTKGGKLILGPTGVYQSALIVYAWQRGMSVDQTISLFDRDVFDYLGYLDVWNSSADEFLRGAKATGMDLENELARWSRRGNFMYTPNHPKPMVMFDIALRAMKASGLPIRDIEVDDYLVDDLVRGIVLPVYPPLADVYGFKASTLFKKEHYKLSTGVGEFLPLPEYIAECFAVFAKHEKPQLANPRVDGWLANDETVRTLAVLSAEAMKRKALAG